MEVQSIDHKPGDKWEFDSEVTSCFEDMLERSIPQYDVMREAVHALVRKYAVEGTAIVDLGTSRGGAIAPLIEAHGRKYEYIGIECSQPMADAAAERFKVEIADGFVRIESRDLRNEFPAVRASVFMAVLTLQFVPINYRQQIARDVFENLLPGGSFIMVEKVLGHGAGIDESMVTAYHEMKARHGYSYDNIDRKRESLEGVLVPVTAKWNEDLLRQAGFNEVDCFWRWMNFAGWVAVKGSQNGLGAN